MNGQTLIDKVSKCFRGYNTGDVELMMSTFDEDVTAYFIALPPVHGSENLAQFWKRVYDTIKARWTVDHAIVAGQEVVLEWSMDWPPSEWSKVGFARGTEWYLFKNEKIAEIRHYGNIHSSGPDQILELRGFPYLDRGYPGRDDFDSHLP